MGKRGHSEEEILRVLREAESGDTVVEICRKHGISQQSFYLWKKKYAGLGLQELRELRQTDWLGTRRMQVSPTGGVEETCQNLPFGDGQSCGLNPAVPTSDDANELHFTGKQRDPESGNDYFGARYYSSNMARFMNPDWSAKAEPVPYSKLDDPQTLNLYDYVRNNPLSGVDADGHSWTCTGDYNCTLTLGEERNLERNLVSIMQGEDIANQVAQENHDAIGGDGAPANRFTRDASGNLVYTKEPYGGPFSTCDSCLHVSDPYGAPRDGGTTMHGGIDLATGGHTGINSLSLTDGKVVRIGATGFGPHSVTILSPSGTYFTYGHFASNLVNVGDSVRAGAPLGEIGTMGNSTGIHVHIQATTIAPFGATQRFLGISFP